MGVSYLVQETTGEIGVATSPLYSEGVETGSYQYDGTERHGLPRRHVDRFPPLSRPTKTTFFTSMKGQNWEHYTCSNFFLCRYAPVVDHDIADLLQPGNAIRTNINVSIAYLVKEEVLTRSALITALKGALCQEVAVGLSTIFESDRCAWFEDWL